MRKYGNALKKAQRKNKVENLPPIIIPDWFFENNVTLFDDLRHIEPKAQLSQCEIEVKDKATGKKLTNFALKISRGQASLLLKRLHSLRPSRQESLLEADTSGAVAQNGDLTSQATNGTKEVPAVELKEGKVDDVPPYSKMDVWILAEIKVTIAACLSIAPKLVGDNNGDGLSTTIVLHSPQDFGASSLNKAVESIGGELGADIIRLDAQDIAELVGDYLTGSDQAQSSIKSLGYDTYKMKSELREAVDEDGLDEDANESEDEGWEESELQSPSKSLQGTIKPVTLSKNATFFPASIMSMIQFALPQKVLALKRLNAENENDNYVFSEPNNWNSSSPSKNWDDIKLTNYLEALCNANKFKGQNFKSLKQDKPGSGFFSPSVATLIGSDGKLVEAEEFEMDHLLSERTLSQISVTIRVDPINKIERAHRAKKSTILLLKDILEMQATKQGSQILEKFEEIVRKKRLAGERIAIVGTTCTQEFIPERSKSGIRSVQLDGETSMRTIIVPLSQKDQSMDSLDAFLSNIGKEDSVTPVKDILQQEDQERNAEINLRHLQSALRTLDPSSFRSIDVEAGSSLALKFLMSRSLKQRIFNYSEVYRIALTAIGLRETSHESDSLTTNHVSLAMSLLHSSDEAKFASLAQEYKTEEETSTSSKKQPYLQRDEVVESLHRTADKYEQRLLGGVINAANIKTNFSDVHAPPQTIEALQTLTSLSILRPDAFTYGVLASNKIPGLLLYGPPGTGKTLLAKAVARESGARMLEVSGSDTNQMYVGESEKIIRAIFSLARKLSPCVVFIDEADAIFGSRSGPGSTRSGHRETINQFLREWDGMNDLSVFIMVATNRPFDLDDAVLRRLPRRLLVDLPTKADREKILGIHLRDETLDPSVSLDTLAAEIPLYSGSDIKNLAVAAALACVKEENDAARRMQANVSAEARPSDQTLLSAYPPRRILHRRHFDKALAEIGASINEDMSSLSAIKKFDEQFGDRVMGSKKKRKGWGFGVPPANQESDADRARVRT